MSDPTTPATDTAPVPLTVGALFARAARRFGERCAIRDARGSISFAELDRLRLRAAQAFLGAGLAHGDRVGVWAPNMAEYIVAVAGLQSIGGILVPLNTRFKTAETSYILGKSGAVMLFTVEEFAGNRYLEMLHGAELPALRRTVLLRGTAAGTQTWEAFLAAGDAAAAQGGAAFAQTLAQRLEAVQPDDLHDMMFTSGTTGMPKGVRFTHRQSIETYDQFSTRMGELNENDRYLIINPFFHTFGYKAGWLSCMMRGASIHPMEAFDPEETMRRIQDERITVLPGPPTIFAALLSHPRRAHYDLSSLRVSLTGATMIPIDLIHRMASELRIDRILSAYGLTETCGLVNTSLPQDSMELIAHTVGVAIDGLQVKCIDANGQDLGTGQQGEIALRGPAVLSEYFEDPQGTREAFTADGFLRTGDLGILEASGHIRITGRIKDIYIVGGFNCYPAEIEEMLRAMDGVDQVAVIGVPDARLGEVGKACIIRRPGAIISAQEVVDWAAPRMANFKLPRYVEFMDAFPLNASLKVLKTRLRELHDPARAQRLEPTTRGLQQN